MKKFTKEHLIQLLAAAVIALFSVMVSPYFHPKPVELTPSMTDLSNPEMPGMVMASFPLDSYDTLATVPSVTFHIERDGADGWNLHILASNFSFTPQNVNGAPVPNEGHAHLYIDGALTVVYGPWFHIDALSPGTHIIAVSLNANDHSVFTYNGVKIQSVQQVSA